MVDWISIAPNIILPITNIITLGLLIKQLRGSSNVNTSNYLLTLDKYFAENGDIQEIYKILSDYTSCPILCDFEHIKTNQLSTYLTFLENFNMLISKSKVLTAGELYNLFGYRIFSMLHNKKIQCFEIEKYKDHYVNLFMLHEALFVYCVKHNRKIPYIHNAKYFVMNGKGEYKSKYKKYRKKIESMIKEGEDLLMEKYEGKFIKRLADPISMKVRCEVHEERDCYFRQCINDDYSAIIEIQEKVIADLKCNDEIFVPTEKDKIKEFFEQDDIYFVCVQTPNGICAYSYTLFNDKTDYINVNFKNKKVATFDTVVVLPEFRGNNLQQKLLEISCEEAMKRNYDIIASIVSLKNIPSINNFITNGFKILKITKFKEHDRYIVYKKLRKC